jgi:hypothetical protein
MSEGGIQMPATPEMFIGMVYDSLLKTNKSRNLPFFSDSEAAAVMQIGNHKYAVVNDRPPLGNPHHVAQLFAHPRARDKNSLRAYTEAFNFEYTIMSAGVSGLFVSKHSVYFSSMNDLLAESDLFGKLERAGSAFYEPGTLSYTQKSAEFVAQGIEQMLKKVTLSASSGRFRVA